MRLTEIHIDGFGTWKDLSLGDLPEGVTVIYGPNEAGKTTVMQFVRSVLYGFSAERRKRYLPPVRGGRPGGSLGVIDHGTTYRAVRHAGLDDAVGYLGEAAIVSPDGVNLGPQQLEQILAGIDEATFNNVFALGLREIQELGSLDDTGAADHLYRLTGGLDRVSLVDVVRELQAGRKRVLPEGETAGTLANLLARRERLRDERRELGGRTERWLKLAAQRSELQHEADLLEAGINEEEERVRRIDAALQARDTWQARREIDDKLAKIGEPKRIHKKYVLLLKKLKERIAFAEKDLVVYKERRGKIIESAKEIKITQPIWSQAARIEALTEHTGWVQSLESQIERLRNELRGYETAVQSQTASVGSPGFDVSGANAAAITALRRPAKAISEEEDRLESAKRNAAEAKAEYQSLMEKFDARLAERNEPDLQTALQNAGERIQMFRRRSQIEQRLDQLSRHREELENYRDDVFERQVTPLWMTIGLGALFATGIMLILLAAITKFVFHWEGGIYDGGMAIIGFLLTLFAAVGKVGVERQAGLRLDGVRRQLTMVNRQLGEFKQQSDQLDEVLPRTAGTLEVRVMRAEDDLKRLEELIPLQSQRDILKSKCDAAARFEQEVENAVKEAKNRWRAALRAHGLPETFSLTQAKQYSQKGEEITQSRRQLDAVRDELQQRERELLSLATRIDQLMGDIRLKPVSERPQDRLEQLQKAIETQRDLSLKRSEYKRELRNLRKEYEKVHRRLKRDQRGCEAIFEKVAVRNEKEFHKAVDRRRLFVSVTKRRTDLTTKLLAVLAGRITEEQLDYELLPHDDGTPETRRENALFRIREHRGRLGQIHERRGQAQAEMASLAEDRRLDEVKVELGVLERQIAHEMRRWQVLAATEHTLTSVRKIYETHRQPETLREASEYLKQLTEGHYVRLWTPLEERTLRVDDADGKPLRLDVLSRGTREAIFLSLRLALTNSFARRGAKLPLVFDDILVNFDSNRVRLAAETLLAFAKQHGHQVLMFTCHEHIMRIFKAANAEIRVLPGHDLQLEPQPIRIVEQIVPAPVVAPPTPKTPPVVVETVPDFHEFAYRFGERSGQVTDLWDVQYNDVYGVDEIEEVQRPQPRPFIPQPAAPVYVTPPVASYAPVAVMERPVIQRRPRFAWESPERYVEDEDS